MDAISEWKVPPHFGTDDPELDRLLKPGSLYRVPEDVVNDAGLSLTEKRAILASWASDACAVNSKPALRRPPGALDPISFDAIMAALQELDRKTATEFGTTSPCRRDRDSSPLC